MHKRMLIKGGTLVDPSRDINERRDIMVEDGLILDTAPSFEVNDDAVEIIEADGLMVMPGMVDMHVHLREPGGEEKETVRTGAAAAVAGGVTSVCCMPNTNPPIDHRLAVDFIKEKAERAGLARVYPIAALTRGRAGKEMVNYGFLIREGVCAFSDDGSFVPNSQVMFNILNYLKQFNAVAIQHCEDEDLMGEGVAHQGYWSTMLGLPGAPAVSEVAAVARDILLAQATGGRLHIAHVSCAGSVEWIRWAKEKGINVTAEVTPHHLLLTHASLVGFNPMAKMRPPLRTPDDCRALLQGLQEGVIDVIATDHAPHNLEDKSRDFFEASFGVSGLDFSLSLLFSELVRVGPLTLSQLVDRYSCRPAEILGLPGGTLKPGAPADIVIMDPEADYLIDPAAFYSKGKNTPFAGWRCKGKPVMTFVGGALKMRNGEVLSS